MLKKTTSSVAMTMACIGLATPSITPNDIRIVAAAKSACKRLKKKFFFHLKLLFKSSNNIGLNFTQVPG